MDPEFMHFFENYVVVLTLLYLLFRGSLSF